MSSTFSTNKSLELPANGDYVDTWNVPVNGDLTVIDTAFGGTTNLNATAGSATLTYTQYRPLILSVSGAVTANVTYTIPAGVGGQWIVRNNMTDTSGGPWDLIIASGGGGTSAVISRGFSTTIYSDGTNISYSDSRLSTAAGSNRQIQYNNNGVLGASSTFVYDASGNVGIGTASPSTSIHVYKSGTASLRLQNATTAIDSYVDASYGVFGTITNSPLIFTTNNGERIRIDSTGNVGIGTASPGAKLTVNDGNNNVRMSRSNDSTTANYLSGYGASGTAQFYFGYLAGDTTLQISNVPSSPITFSTSGTERMRIDTSGNLLVGTTTALNGTTIQNAGGGQMSLRNTTTAGGRYYSLGVDSSSNFIIYNEGGTGVYLSYGGTSWLANSDERLKEIVEPISDGLSKVNTLRAIIGAYKSDEEKTRRPFLIAQDVQAVLPEAVDASNPDKLGLAYSEVIPLLVAAIQELSAKNDALEARLAKLENAQ